MTRKYFGTDGIRGKVGQTPITPEFILKLGWAVGKVLAGGNGARVIIGKDTRISGYIFESALEAGLASAGANVYLLGPMPTPAIAYLTRTLHAKAGIVISASHNPYYDNGIKFFSAAGTKLPDEVEQAIEAQLEQEMICNESADLGKAVRVKDAEGRYIEFCKSTIPYATSLKGLKVVIDCAHGAGYWVGPSVLRELGAEVIAIGNKPDGLNINDGAGSTTPAILQETVLKEKADLGIALDGDADRVIMVDHIGELVDGDELLYVIALARKNNNELKGGVVGTLMSNLGLEHALEKVGIPFRRAAVGDRYVMELLQEEGWVLGGESSGHIICLDRTTTGDGIVAALQVLAAMVQTGQSLQELGSGMRKYPQTLLNIKMAQRINVCEQQPVKAALQEAEASLSGTGRVLLRASGTEPLIRVMVEGQDADKVKTVAEGLADVVRQAVSA